jgi:hypothetical protein
VTPEEPSVVEPVETSAPLILIKGDATEEEVAALVAVLQGLAASAAVAATTDEPGRVSQWASPHRKVRASYPHGPGGWRASALPR